jgi:hypothetical protein
MTIATPCGPRRLSRAARIIVVGSALAAGCRDAPTAPTLLPGQTASLDLQSTSLGIPASELPPSAVLTAIADSATIPLISGITYTGQPEQVAVLTAPDSGFPTSGATYLVVSSGDARDPRIDGSWTWTPHPLDAVHGCACYPGTGDEASITITVNLPVNATSLELDYRFFTADNVIWTRPIPWVEWSSIGIRTLSGTSLGGAYGSPTELAFCPYPGAWPYFRCTSDFTWFPDGVRRLTMDVRAFAGQTVVLTADARDHGQGNTRQTGVAIDGLRVVRSNLAPLANAGGPYLVDEGQVFEVDASASSDPEGGALSFGWDLDADGDFDDAANPRATLTFHDDGVHTVRVRVSDVEGATAISSALITVHNVAPTVSVTGPTVVHPQLGHASVSIGVEFSDPGADTHSATIDCDNGGSPVQLGSITSPFSQECSYTTSAFGSRTIRVTVTDDDDGSSAVTHAVAILYTWTGFFPPVGSAPVENRAKAGSAIPLKFGLGGDQGFGVFVDGSPASRPASCGGDVLDGPIEASTPGASQLTYNGALGLYHYGWKTEKGWAGTCRQLDIRLADGTVHSAHFRFK